MNIFKFLAMDTTKKIPPPITRRDTTILTGQTQMKPQSRFETTSKPQRPQRTTFKTPNRSPKQTTPDQSVHRTRTHQSPKEPSKQTTPDRSGHRTNTHQRVTDADATSHAVPRKTSNDIVHLISIFLCVSYVLLYSHIFNVIDVS